MCNCGGKKKMVTSLKTLIFSRLFFFGGILLANAASPSLSCSPITRKTEAKSVYNLSPSQVDVVMALGDSVTAAFGAMGRQGHLHEFRGQSWAMGGDSNATTLPNYIKEHSPFLKGYSEGKRPGSLCWGPVCRDIHRPNVDRLNAALSGAMIKNIPRVRVHTPHIVRHIYIYAGW